MSGQFQITTQNVLEPWVIRTIREAFEDALDSVQERDGPDAPPPSKGVRARLARHIVALARTGECSVNRLRDLALNELRFGSASA